MTNDEIDEIVLGRLSEGRARLCHYRGNPIEFIRNAWRYLDGVRVDEDKDRPCGHCKQPATPEGHDACLGHLPGAKNACCGHGHVRDAYVVDPDGNRLVGDDAKAYFLLYAREESG